MTEEGTRVQRILQPGEIEALDAIDFPRIRLPRPTELFAERAARLRQLAPGNPIADYLLFIARVCEAQAGIAATLQTTAPDAAVLERALEHGMPPLPLQDRPDPAWQAALAQLLERVLAGAADLPAVLVAHARRLQALDAAALDQLAADLLNEDGDADALAVQPLVMAALQLVWADRASRLDAARLAPAAEPTVCPACGSPPLASVLRIGGSAEGHRYLHCGLCATEWHMVRVKCSHCQSTRGVRYLGVDGDGKAVLAETCDHCRSYRKQVDQHADPLAEALADDLATLRLDLLMAETNFERASGNPLLALPEPTDDA
nr:formate dehydrogenase accessory protein FdhE [Rubrivivax gelatinosus]